jgi:molybdate-binding protein/DNA-binding XRE family transcriptional regulator
MHRSGIDCSLEFHRRSRGWSQAELALRAHTSRAEVSAIETGRHVPSTEVALALARALDCRVEDLFRLLESETAATWAWKPRRTPCRVVRAEVAGHVVLYPVDDTTSSFAGHDGIHDGAKLDLRSPGAAERTVVVAGCDPAVGHLASAVEATSAFRFLAVTRSSSKALELLRERRVHAAGIHLSDPSQPHENETVVRRTLGAGYRLLRIASWQEGVAFHPDLGFRSLRAALGSKHRWIAREEGSGARRCLDRLLGARRAGRTTSQFTAYNHRAVVEAIRSGWAQAGICPRLCAEEAGLGFFAVQSEDYDLCYAAALEGDPRLAALVEAVRSAGYRQVVRDLEGYDSRLTGELENVS